MSENKLASRKLWVAIGGVLLVLGVEILGLDAESTKNIVNAIVFIVPSYIGGQSAVDLIKAYISKSGNLGVDGNIDATGDVTAFSKE